MKVASRYGVSALVVLALALVVMPVVRAGAFNHSTRVTFNNSIQLPGVVLAPGDYRFELLDSPANRHIVRVFNAEHSHVFGTFFTVPVERAQATGKTVFVMEERPYGEPEAIKQWFYPGEWTGDEFIYSRDDSSKVAVATSTTDVVTPTEPAVSEQLQAPAAKSEEEAVTPAAPESTAPAVSEEPKAAQPEAQAAPQESKAPEPEKKEAELPKTASNLYLFLLIGSASVLSGVAIRRFAKS